MVGIIPVVLFALIPVVANPGIIHYKIFMCQKLRETTTKKLTEELFDYVPDNFFADLNILNDRASCHD